MQRMQVYLPGDLFIDLKTQAAVRELSMSELIRRGLRNVLRVEKKKLDPMKEFVGKCKAKVKTDAVKEIDNYYQKGLA